MVNSSERNGKVMEILRVEHLKKTYGEGENAVHALDDVSFSVEKGEFTAIIGPSGSGKSTLLHILGAVDVPTSGKVYMDGQDVFAQNEEELAVFRRRQVGLFYQFYNPYSSSGGAGKASAQPAFRWTAAESFHWKSTHECTGSSSGG